MRVAEPPLAAVAFLTRIPVGRLAELDGAAVRRAAPLFPLVGGAIGALGGGVVDVAAGPLPSLGRGGARPRRRLRSSPARCTSTPSPTPRTRSAGRRGSAGSRSCATTRSDRSAQWRSWSCCCSRRRCSPRRRARGARSPRQPPAGAGRRCRSRRSSLGAREEGTALSDLSLAERRPRPAGGVRRRRRCPGQSKGSPPSAAAALTALVLGLFFRRWLGGVTGDTLGATSELAQAAALAALVLA